jgi:hypothetical protein
VSWDCPADQRRSRGRAEGHDGEIERVGLVVGGHAAGYSPFGRDFIRIAHSFELRVNLLKLHGLTIYFAYLAYLAKFAVCSGIDRSLQVAVVEATAMPRALKRGCRST